MLVSAKPASCGPTAVTVVGPSTAAPAAGTGRGCSRALKGSTHVLSNSAASIRGSVRINCRTFSHRNLLANLPLADEAVSTGSSVRIKEALAVLIDLFPPAPPTQRHASGAQK